MFNTFLLCYLIKDSIIKCIKHLWKIISSESFSFYLKVDCGRCATPKCQLKSKKVYMGNFCTKTHFLSPLEKIISKIVFFESPYCPAYTSVNKKKCEFEQNKTNKHVILQKLRHRKPIWVKIGVC